MKSTRGSQIISSDYEDDVYAFFMHCYHLKDWIKNDASVKSRMPNLGTDVEQFIKESEAYGSHTGAPASQETGAGAAARRRRQGKSRLVQGGGTRLIPDCASPASNVHCTLLISSRAADYGRAEVPVGMKGQR